MKYSLLREIPLWARSFGENFFTVEYLIATIFAFLIWLFVGMIADLLDEMGLDAALIHREVLSAAVREQGPPRQRLMAFVFGLGAPKNFSSMGTLCLMSKYSAHWACSILTVK